MSRSITSMKAEPKPRQDSGANDSSSRTRAEHRLRAKNRRTRCNKTKKSFERLLWKAQEEAASALSDPLKSLDEMDLASIDSVLRQFDHSQIQDASRMETIDFLEATLGQWAQTYFADVSCTDNNNNAKSSAWKEKVIPPTIVSFGSHRLGVSMDNSDLDLLVVAPSRMSRDDFFGPWVEHLRHVSGVKHVQPIPEAYTPVLRFEINEIPVDMLFCSLRDNSRLAAWTRNNRHSQLFGPPEDFSPSYKEVTKGSVSPILPPQVREEYEITDEDLVGQDEYGLRSLNAPRVSQMILELVPNLDTYRVVLRAVKCWATRQGIYSNVLGFLGGINWAILVARVCCFHPEPQKATPAELWVTFYHTFAHWGWPHPVVLHPIVLKPPKGVAPMRVWDPVGCRNDPAAARRYAAELMPIITPAYPAMNSSYNVGKAQFRVLKSAFGQALKHIRDMDVDAIFQPTQNFWHESPAFLEVSIKAGNKNDFVAWFRYVESRLRNLIKKLETPEIEARPQSRFYHQAYNDHGEVVGEGWSARPDVPQEALFFIGLKGAKRVNLTKDTHPLLASFLHQVNQWSKRKVPSMGVTLNILDAAEVSDFCRTRVGGGGGGITYVNTTAVEDVSACGKLTPRTSEMSMGGDESLASTSSFSGSEDEDCSTDAPSPEDSIHDSSSIHHVTTDNNISTKRSWSSVVASQ